MATRKPKSLKELLGNTDTTVGSLVERCAAIDTLTTAVKDSLPEAMRPHLLAASRRDQTLCLIADSAVWAAKMRYHAPDILTYLDATQGPGLQKIKVGVAAGARP